ncbi:MAG: GntR family transcriptional regulator [Microbacteriaceae bacterium]|nr:GntR family transcriptional regulator [Microbacteriaceae bacterium]
MTMPWPSAARSRLGQQSDDADGGRQLAGANSFRGLHGQIVEAVGLSIASGVHSSGDQIVPEALGEDFEVSRTVIREVLKVLEAKGMVQARPRTGTRVRPSNDWNLLDPDVIRWRSIGDESVQQLEELLGLRSAIEPLAARQACRERTPESLARLRSALEAMSDASDAKDWAWFTNADVEFHRALLLASGNMIVEQLADPIEAALRVRFQLNLVPREFTREAIESHRAIVDAVEARDEREAELTSRRIVDVAGMEIMASLPPGQD